jgi:hypothetical protein
VEVIALLSATSSAFALHIDRADATWCRRVKILRANRFAMTGQQSLPQLVVYGNRLAVAATSGRKRQLSANSGVWALFGLRINTQFHIHKTYVTTRQ